MSDNIKQVAVRIRELREIEGYSVERFAEKMGIDIDTYREYEAGTTDMPISFLYEVANKLQVDMTTILTGIVPKLSKYSLVRNGDGLSVERSKQYKYKTLAYNFQNKMAEVMLVTVEPQSEDTPIPVNTHTGQEITYVVAGTIVMKVDKDEITLNVGDTLYFNSKYPHGMKAVGDTDAQCLTIIMDK